MSSNLLEVPQACVECGVETRWTCYHCRAVRCAWHVDDQHLCVPRKNGFSAGLGTAGVTERAALDDFHAAWLDMVTDPRYRQVYVDVPRRASRTWLLAELDAMETGMRWVHSSSGLGVFISDGGV